MQVLKRASSGLTWASFFACSESRASRCFPISFGILTIHWQCSSPFHVVVSARRMAKTSFCSPAATSSSSSLSAGSGAQ